MDGAYGLCKRRKKKKLIKTNYNIVFFRSYINNILMYKVTYYTLL